jgi:hypothetical protein
LSQVSLAAIERGGYWAQALSLTINHVPSSALNGLVATARSQNNQTAI